jgi:hypothetical protein
MTESKAVETSVKSFLVGMSVGAILAMVMKPRNISGPTEQASGTIDTASEGSFLASDAPAY